MKPDTIATLAAAYPDIEWTTEPAQIVGYIRRGSVRFPVSVIRESGWFRAEVFGPSDEEIVGMDPRDPVRAVRVALRRFDGGARTLPLHIVG